MLWLATSCHLFAFKPDLVQDTNHKQRLTEALNPKQDKAAKLAVILKSGLLIEVGDGFVPVSNRLLDCVSVRLEREIQVATGDRLHVKANQNLAFGPRVMNGGLITAKSVRPDGGVELTDGCKFSRVSSGIRSHPSRLPSQGG